MVFLCPFLGMACLWDYNERRIPNVIPAGIWGVGMIYRYSASGWRGLFEYIISLTIVTLVLFPLFRLGMIGGGDVKLIAVSSGYFPGKDAVIFVIMVFVLSAIPALVKIIRSGSIGSRFGFLGKYIKSCMIRKEAGMYMSGKEDRIRAGIAMSGPVLASAVLHWGGVY